jgi:hypothetical protein
MEGQQGNSMYGFVGASKNTEDLKYGYRHRVTTNASRKVRRIERYNESKTRI